MPAPGKPEQYAAPGTYGRGGLRATMVHILDNLWQQRITPRDFTGNLWQMRPPMTRRNCTRTPSDASPGCKRAGRWNSARCGRISTC